MEENGKVALEGFDNSWYDPGRGIVIRALWLAVGRAFFLTWFPWPNATKTMLLRLFGARVGAGVVIKPRVNIKYPWNLDIGEHSWIGEGAWLDSIANITIGRNACLSQGCMIETGNHDWTAPNFDLKLGSVTVGDGAWAAVRSTLLPGSGLADHAVLGAGGVLVGHTEPYGVYGGVPATLVRRRRVRKGVIAAEVKQATQP